MPALRLRAAVSMVKELAAGDAVSYGCTFRAPKPMRAATLAVGYADGYPRALSGRGTVCCTAGRRGCWAGCVWTRSLWT